MRVQCTNTCACKLWGEHSINFTREYSVLMSRVLAHLSADTQSLAISKCKVMQHRSAQKCTMHVHVYTVHARTCTYGGQKCTLYLCLAVANELKFGSLALLQKATSG